MVEKVRDLVVVIRRTWDAVGKQGERSVAPSQARCLENAQVWV